MPWSSNSCNDRRYSYFTRNIYNRCVDSLKILFKASSEVYFAIVTTTWRPGLTSFPETSPINDDDCLSAQTLFFLYKIKTTNLELFCHANDEGREDIRNLTSSHHDILQSFSFLQTLVLAGQREC